jgi:hypothetical protein
MENRFQSIVSEKSNEELLTMVYQFADWDPQMLDAVETELQNRNILPADVAVRKQELAQQEDEALSQGRTASAAGIIIGWIFVLGFIGLYLGYNYAFSKRRNKYTQKEYFKYELDSRENGRYIFYASLAAIILEILYAFVKFAGTV